MPTQQPTAKDGGTQEDDMTKAKRHTATEEAVTIYKIELCIKEGSQTIGVSVFKNGVRHGPGYTSNSMTGALSYLRGVLVW